MTATPISHPSGQPHPPHVLTLVLVAALPALSMNIFLPSLPSMAEFFDVDYAVMQLSVSLYLAMTAFLQILIGPISDRFGRRPVLLGATAIFVLASVVAAATSNFALFLSCRMVQAVIATGMVLSRAAVRDLYPQDQSASMIGYVTMGMSIVPMFAPVIGGWLDEVFGWQATFWLLSICGAGLLALIWFDFRETATSRSASFAEQSRQYPELLRSPRFWGYCMASAFASGAFFAYLGGAPYVGTVFYGLPPAALGLYFGAPAFGYLFGNFLSGRFSVRVGVNQMILYGAAATTAGLALLLLLTLAGAAHPMAFFAPFIAVGLGNGMVLPNATAGMLSVRPNLAGSASGLGGAMMLGGGAALSVLAGVVLGPDTGPMPLVLLTLATAIASLLCILYVIRRERILSGL